MSPSVWAAGHPCGKSDWPGLGPRDTSPPGGKPGPQTRGGQGPVAGDLGRRRLLERTSAGEPGVRICVHKKLHLEQVSHLLGVEGQDPFKEHHVCGVDSNRLLLPAKQRAEDGLGQVGAAGERESGVPFPGPKGGQKGLSRASQSPWTTMEDLRMRASTAGAKVSCNQLFGAFTVKQK